MDSITILYLNCQGLGKTRKRRDVFHCLKQKSCSIYCLQDTHFSTKLETYVKAEWGYNCFFASYSSNLRGVAVMFMNYDKASISGIAKSDLELTVSDKVFLDFLLMKIRSRTISYATMKK